MNVKFSNANGRDPVSTLGFTDDQQKAYLDLIQFIANDYDEKDYKRALVGAAGTGKTYLVKALIKNCSLSYSVIGLAAPTHKACRVLQEAISLPSIKVNTLQSDLGLRLNFNVDKFDINHPPFDPRGRIKIGDYKLYIVDEASMINRGLCTFLEKTCKTNKCKIIYIGDDSQLAPVGEKYSSSLRGIKTYKLNKIVRQEDDNPIRYLLDLLRYDIQHRTFKFLEHISKVPEKFDDTFIKGYQVCCNEEFGDVVYNYFNDEQITKNVDYVKVVTYTNLCVSGWNTFIRNSIIADSHKAIVTKNDLFISYTTLVDSFNTPIIKNSEEYIVHDIVNYVHPKYELKGFMVKFQAIHGGAITSPLFIVDHSDAFTKQKYVTVADKLINDARNANSTLRAEKWKTYFSFKESCLLLTNFIKRDGTPLYTRDLDYGFALTAHKSQGSTFDTVFVDVNDIVFDKYGHVYTDVEEINRRLYVACSRAKTKLYLKYGK